LTVNAEDQNQLVVVQVGYGTVKKKDAAGAVTVLTAKDFNKDLLLVLIK
jgi:iron complex outermembrane receptor protein